MKIFYPAEYTYSYFRPLFQVGACTTDIMSQNLIIALEPEAASLYCRTLAMGKFTGMRGVRGEMAMKPGEKYIIVDCGGMWL